MLKYITLSQEESVTYLTLVDIVTTIYGQTQEMGMRPTLRSLRTLSQKLLKCLFEPRLWVLGMCAPRVTDFTEHGWDPWRRTFGFLQGSFRNRGACNRVLWALFRNSDTCMSLGCPGLRWTSQTAWRRWLFIVLGLLNHCVGIVNLGIRLFCHSSAARSTLASWTNRVGVMKSRVCWQLVLLSDLVYWSCCSLSLNN